MTEPDVLNVPVYPGKGSFMLALRALVEGLECHSGSGHAGSPHGLGSGSGQPDLPDFPLPQPDLLPFDPLPLLPDGSGSGSGSGQAGSAHASSLAGATQSEAESSTHAGSSQAGSSHSGSGHFGSGSGSGQPDLPDFPLPQPDLLPLDPLPLLPDGSGSGSSSGSGHPQASSLGGPHLGGAYT
jgi:hypothetical protein